MTDSVNKVPAASIVTSLQAEAVDAFTDKNNAHLKSKYASLGSILESVRPALQKFRCSLVFTTGVEQGEGTIPLLTVVGGILCDYHDSSDPANAVIQAQISYPLNSGWTPQQVNAAVTYAKKAVILQLFAITSTEEIEADEDGEQISTEVPKVSAEQVKELRGLLTRAKGTDDSTELCKGFGHESLSDFSVQDYERACQALLKAIARNAKGGAK